VDAAPTLNCLTKIPKLGFSLLRPIRHSDRYVQRELLVSAKDSHDVHVLTKPGGAQQSDARLDGSSIDTCRR
jgi:hypothetical protein